MRDDAVDGEELVIPRVPRLPSEPSARQIAEAGHAVLVSPVRGVERSSARSRCPRRRRVARNCIDCGFSGRDKRRCVVHLVCQMQEPVQPDAWQRQLLTGSDYASSYPTAFNREFKRVVTRAVVLFLLHVCLFSCDRIAVHTSAHG